MTQQFQRHLRRVAVALVGFAALPAASAGAQQQAGSWQAWYGCWAPAVMQTPDSVGAAATVLTCFVPAAGDEVGILKVQDGKVVERTTHRADGVQRAANVEGCTGWEKEEWSRDGRRVFRRAEHQCGALQRVTSGVLAILPDGEWVNVQGVSAGGYTDVRVLRSRAVPLSDALPAEVLKALDARQMSIETARVAAAAPLQPAQIAEASKLLAPEIVSAWLIERGQGFTLDAQTLASLADAGVPGEVTDVMIALSYPKTFAINRAAREGEFRPDAALQRGGRASIPVFFNDPFGYYSPYGYNSRYGYGYGSPYGYGYGWYGSRPIIITRPTEPEQPRGKAVKGRGYTSGDNPNRGASSPPPSSGNRPSGEPSTGRSPESGGSGGETRTAKPRGT